MCIPVEGGGSKLESGRGGKHLGEVEDGPGGEEHDGVGAAGDRDGRGKGHVEQHLALQHPLAPGPRRWQLGQGEGASRESNKPGEGGIHEKNTDLR